MKKVTTLLLAALTLTLAACSNQKDVNTPTKEGSNAMAFTANIENSLLRAAGTHFANGDKVGVVPNETALKNLTYTYTDGSFSGNPPYYFQNLNDVNFYAYYPYLSSLSTTGTLDITTQAADQKNYDTGIANNWQKNDILYGTFTGNARSATPSCTFKHIMSKVTLKFKAAGNGITNLSALSSYSIAGLHLEGTFDVKTGKVTPKGSTSTLTMNVTGQDKNELIASPLILIPQEITNNYLPLTVTYNSQSYTAKLLLPNSSKELKAGYHYTFTVTINNTRLSIGNATITDWESSSSDVNATLQ